MLSVCGLPAKQSVKRSAAHSVTDVRRPSAPVFLKGLQDLRVMDGSQVTMTVEVSGMKQPSVFNLGGKQSNIECSLLSFRKFTHFTYDQHQTNITAIDVK